MPDPEDQKPIEEASGGDAGATDAPSEFAAPSTEDAPEATPAEDTLPPGPDESAIVEQPSVDELAAELNKIEDDAAADETATEPQAAQTPADEPPAPDSDADPEPASSEPVDDIQTVEIPPDAETPEPGDGTDPADDETDIRGPTEAIPGETKEELGDRTIAQPVRTQPPSQSQTEKKAADAKRRKGKIDAVQEAMIPLSEADEAEQARKDAIREQMEEVTEDRDDALAHAAKCQEFLTVLSTKLYPHATESDHIVTAVKGYTESQKRLRAHRATEPARLKALLEQAGKAPIDAAFMRQRSRTNRRPLRPQMIPAAKNGDGNQGGGSDANAGKE